MKYTCILALLSFSLFASAQTSNSRIRFVNPLVKDLETVAKDYFQNFSGIKGDKLSETTNTVEYTSTVIPSGALESTILQIKSLENSYSWQAIMMNTEDFAAAAKKYKDLYRQLNGVSFSLGDNKPYIVKGPYDTPTEARTFASSLLEVRGAGQQQQKFIVEVALNYLMPDWTVKLYVYEKEDDDAIRPTASTDY